MGTGTSGTIADVQFTVGACESRSAAAGSAWTSVQALASIGTWIAGTPVYFLLTVGASEVGGAFAGITGPLVALPAGAPIEAGGIRTSQGTVFTVLAIVAWGTQAVVTILLVLTAATISTGVAGTLAEFQLTVLTSVAWETGAGIAPRPTVGTR